MRGAQRYIGIAFALLLLATAFAALALLLALLLAGTVHILGGM